MHEATTLPRVLETESFATIFASKDISHPRPSGCYPDLLACSRDKAVLPGDAAVNTQVAGDYQLLDLPAHVIAEGDRLYFQSQLFGAKRMELFAESKTSFFMTAQDMSIRFERGNDGAITGFALLRGENTYPAKRMK